MSYVDALELTRSPSGTVALFNPERPRRSPAMAIPVEVWRHVFDLLPASVQAALATVNRTCLQTYRAIRYRAIDFEDYGRVTKRLVRLLGSVTIVPTQTSEADGQSIHRDQTVASFVREVRVRPWDISRESRRKKHHLLFRMWVHLNSVLSPAEAERLAHERSACRAHRRIKRIQSALAITPALRYTVEWDEQLPYSNAFFSQLLEPVLSGAMSQSLIHLSLKIPPSTNLTDRLVGIRLPALETLHIEFCLPNGQPHAMHFVEEMRLFVNNVEHPDRAHLQSLEIGVTSSSDPFALSAFFEHLGPFRALDRFQLTIPFNGAHLQDVSGLRTFLLLHARQLHRLAFRTRRMTPAAAHSNPGWVLSALRGICFPRLVSAELALRPVVGPFDVEALADWVRAHAGNLRSLVLTDRQLTPEEVAILVEALDVDIARRVKLRVRRLSASLLDTIARALPLLRKLEITFVDIGAMEESRHGVDSFQRWALERLVLRQPFRTLDEIEQAALANEVRLAIPSLQLIRIQLS
ncbi:hypothetical protein EV122DRAFT_249197 [Schizophyllum commune]